jgi:hypothetical protein
MAYSAVKQEQEAQSLENQELSLEVQVFLSFKYQTSNRYKLLDKLIRANITPEEELTDKTIYLGEKAKKLLRAILKKLFNNRHVLINHKYITQATRCKSDQNTIILKELERIFRIKFYRLYTNDKGTKFSRHYHIELHPEIARELKDSGALNSEFYAEKNRATYTNRNIFNEDKDIDHESNFSINFDQEDSDKNNTTQIIELVKEPVKPAKFKKRLANERKKPTRGGLKARVYKPFAYSKPKTLSDMLPLIDGSTCDELRSKSGRSFSDNFITQLVLKMSRDHRRRPVFNYRSGFIAYMVKALKHELHDAVKTGNIGFRFKANIPVNNNENQAREGLSDTLKPEPIELPKGTWGDICRRLIDIYDEHIYRNWLSKLIIFSDERDKFITLEAPSSFMKEWIETNYWDSIKKIGESVGLELRGISTQACLKGERVFSYGTSSEKVIDSLPGESKPNGFQKISVFEIVDKLQKS